MPYTGEVRRGGPPDVRSIARDGVTPRPGLSLTKVSVGPMDNNAYLLQCEQTGALCLVDAADDAGTLLALLEGRPLDLVVTTHAHPDHWQALTEVRDWTGARTAAGRADAPALPVPVDVVLDHGDEVAFGAVRLAVIGLRGHTPGSVALHHPSGGGHLITGDSLFPGGPGRTRSAADFASLMDDLQDRVFAPLPDHTWVYPGHGKDTTLGAERAALPAWRARGW